MIFMSKKIFACYSLPLMQYLVYQKGLRYEVVGLNENTGNKFWCFYRDEKLNNALLEWGR